MAREKQRLAGMLEKQSRWRKEWSERFFVMEEEMPIRNRNEVESNVLPQCLQYSKTIFKSIYRMRSCEGFLFLSGGLGGRPCSPSPDKSL